MTFDLLISFAPKFPNLRQSSCPNSALRNLPSLLAHLGLLLSPRTQALKLADDSFLPFQKNTPFPSNFPRHGGFLQAASDGGSARIFIFLFLFITQEPCASVVLAVPSSSCPATWFHFARGTIDNAINCKAELVLLRSE